MSGLHILADSGSSGGGGGGAVAVLLFFVVFYLIVILPFWVIFTKAGRPGWYALIPFFNIYTTLKIVGRPGWWLILFFIPIVSLVISIIVMIDLAKSFGRGTGFAIGLILLTWIWAMILAFGSDRYLGPAGSGQPLAPSAA